MRDVKSAAKSFSTAGVASTIYLGCFAARPISAERALLDLYPAPAVIPLASCSVTGVGGASVVVLRAFLVRTYDHLQIGWRVRNELQHIQRTTGGRSNILNKRAVAHEEEHFGGAVITGFSVLVDGTTVAPGSTSSMVISEGAVLPHCRRVARRAKDV
jgi:hypothetical protein